MSNHTMTPNSAPEDHKNPIKKITILLAGNHSVVRQGLRVLLEKQTDLEIVGETSNGLGTLRAVDRLKPAVLIVDLAMPQLSGLEISREITRHRQQTRVLLLSAHANQQSVVDGFKNGASGYLLKSSTIDELIDAIRRIHRGSRYLPPAYSEADIDNFIETIKNSANNGSALLTRRERQFCSWSPRVHPTARSAPVYLSAREQWKFIVQT
jgi:DNA-binding NarL/FixJ family response regulator